MLYFYKMTKKQDLGRKGEDFATDYLEKQGYVIQERNWRYSKAEIDIICKKEDVLIFVEVKTKSYDYYGKPEESVTPFKERLIIDAANRYMEITGHDWEIRFDIIALLTDKEKEFSLEHFKDAFFD